jgi:hypothetical protein
MIEYLLYLFGQFVNFAIDAGIEFLLGSVQLSEFGTI